MVAMSLPAIISSAVFTTAGALSISATGRCDSPSMHFAEFVETYGRSYQVGTEEYEMRRAIFEERATKISSHNCDPVGPWTARINHLTDWSHAELKTLRGHKSMRRAGQGGAASGRMPSLLQENSFEEPLPKNFSWGHLETIKANSSDQKICGSCWAHASRVALQARAEIHGKKLNLSTNQIIACTPNPKHCGGEGGCEGSTAELAYEYVLNYGLMQHGDYVALAGDEDQKTACPAKLKASTEVATPAVQGLDGNELHRVGPTAKLAGAASLGLTGWVKLAENKEAQLLRELMSNGPLYVAVAAGDHWFDYSEGVLSEAACDRDFIVNHAVVLFAWGVKEKTIRGPVKYWQIKNSWGPNWGEHGTGRFIRTDDEEKVCGWDEDPQQGSGCDGGPERVWVCGTCGILYDTVAPRFTPFPMR